MFHHIRKFSSALKGRPISSVLYPKNNNNNNNNNNVVRRVMDDQSRFLLDEEESKKKPAAAGGTLLDQISLRPFELTDIDDIMLWATDDQLSRYCGWEEVGLKGIYTSKEDALEDLENYIIPHPWYRAICLKNQPIGKIFVDPYPGKYRFRAEVFYVVASKYWGKGIATKAVKMVLDTVFQDWPHLERLGALVDVDNLGSIRVLEKAGFLKESVLRKYLIHHERIVDAAIFSFLSTDFKQQQLVYHIRNFSSTVNATSPISSVLYPKNNNNKVVRRAIDDQSRFLLDQISLRPFELTDADDIMLWATDEQLSRYAEWEMYTSKEDVVEDIKNNIIPHPWYRAICLKNQPIGKISVDSYPGAYRFRGDLSYAIASEHWGKGIGTTAVKMVLDTIFKEWPHLERLDAGVHVENLASQRILVKNGFLMEGVFMKYYPLRGRIIDTAVFSFLSTDFKQRRD